jgi:hypothetical protein
MLRDCLTGDAGVGPRRPSSRAAGGVRGCREGCCWQRGLAPFRAGLGPRHDAAAPIRPAAGADPARGSCVLACPSGPERDALLALGPWRGLLRGCWAPSRFALGVRPRGGPSGSTEYLRAARSGVRPRGGPSGSTEYLRPARSGVRPRAALRAQQNTFALRAPVFALGAALRAQQNTSRWRAPVFALGAALRVTAQAQS